MSAQIIELYPLKVFEIIIGNINMQGIIDKNIESAKEQVIKLIAAGYERIPEGLTEDNFKDKIRKADYEFVPFTETEAYAKIQKRLDQINRLEV